MQTRDGLFRDRHFIPGRVDHWQAAKPPEFIAEREKLIWAAMKRRSPSRRAEDHRRGKRDQGEGRGLRGPIAPTAQQKGDTKK